MRTNIFKTHGFELYQIFNFVLPPVIKLISPVSLSFATLIVLMELPIPLLPKTQDASTLKAYALLVRRLIIRALTRAGSGHLAGAMGQAEILVTLYFAVLNHDHLNPAWTDRDRFLLSNGHTCVVWYATLALAGYFLLSELKTLRQLHTHLQGHPWRTPASHPLHLPGIENSSGPLGQGISQAAGSAWALKHDRSTARVFCLMSDAEFQEGQTWEALFFAMHHRLNNLTALVDYNHIQISGFVDQIMNVEPLKQKLIATGWHVFEADGHDPNSILDAINQAKNIQDRPSIILAHTIPGKGVSFMENNPSWHGKAPNIEEALRALVELEPLPKHLRVLDRID